MLQPESPKQNVSDASHNVQCHHSVSRANTTLGMQIIGSSNHHTWESVLPAYMLPDLTIQPRDASACEWPATPSPLGNGHIRPHVPLEKDTTAHFPFHAHFRAPESPPPPSICFSFSSTPGSSPTTTSALHVLSARTLRPDPGPSGPIASVNGVVGSHATCLCQ
jgi:hypothetical protein